MILTIILFGTLTQLILNAYVLLPPPEGMALKEAYMHLGKGIFRGLCWSSLFALFISFAKGRYTRIVFVISSLIYLAFLSVEVILLCEQQMVYNQSAALIFLSSNPQETAQFLESTVSLSALLLPIAGLLLIFFAVHWLSGLVRSRLHLRLRVTRIALSSIVLLGLVPSSYLIWRKVQAGFCPSFHLSTTDRMIWSTYSAIREGYLLEEFITLNANTAKGQITSVNETRPHRIVIIIGESLRRDYLHAYGYPLSTTPFTDSLIAIGNMVTMNDVLSPASSTLKSVMHMMTFRRTTDTNPWYTYPTLTLMLEEAGYHTRWMSNQESKGFYVQPLSAIAKQAQETYFTKRPSLEDDANSLTVIYDEELLNIFDGLHTLDSISYCDVYHIQGSHYTYTSRYPEAFNRFRGEDIKRIQPESKLADWQYQRIAEYANSVLYSDYVVSQIINRYKDTPTVVFYLSDHGEILFDDPKHPQYVGHGHAPTLKSVSIPMLVYVSPTMQTMRPDILPRIQKAKSKRFMSDLLPNSILELMGIESPLVKPHEALFSIEYDESRPRYIISNIAETNEPASLLLDQE